MVNNSNLESYLKNKLAYRRKDETFRQLKSWDSNQIDFVSNDYLGLSSRSETDSEITVNENFGATGSRLISGNTLIHEKLESFLSDFHESEAALIFNSGYLANVGLLSAITSKGDLIAYDQECHASIRDGILISRANSYKFKHNNLEDLERLLKTETKNKFVVIEALYSMSGKESSVLEINELCQKYGATLILDECHSVGVLGEGKGILFKYGIDGRDIIRILGFGKALGAMGGAVLCAEAIKEYLINFCRPFIYTTALAPILVEQILSNYHHLAEYKLPQKLEEVWAWFNEAFTGCVNVEPREGPIQIFKMHNISKLIKLEKMIHKRNFSVKLIKSPTVIKGGELIRICVHTFNTRAQIECLAEIIKENNAD